MRDAVSALECMLLMALERGDLENAQWYIERLIALGAKSRLGARPYFTGGGGKP